MPDEEIKPEVAPTAPSVVIKLDPPIQTDEVTSLKVVPPAAPAAPTKPPAPLGRNGRPVLSRHYAPLVLAVLMLWPLLGCTWLESVAANLPPVQLCVTYKGRQFCAQKVNGVWKFEADLTAEEQAEVVNGIEGGR